MSTATEPISAGAYLRRAATSSLGAKVLMAASGLLFYGWLTLHLLGNLSIFAGPGVNGDPAPIDEYAHLLQSKPALLWAQRIALLAIVGIHVAMGLRLSALNKAARPQPYASPRRWRQASLASRTMALSGLVVLGFIVFHLAHFTLGVVDTDLFRQTIENEVNGRRGVYALLQRTFSNPLYATIYAVAMGFIGFHLSHAIWSATQTLGLNGPKWTPLAKKAGLAVGVGLAALFATIPLAGLFGLLK
jgi:succinate dehydrogenase / fumarate reductase cytochrome b subunit